MQFKTRVAAPVLAISLAVAALPANALAAFHADSLAAATVSVKPDSLAPSETPKLPPPSRRPFRPSSFEGPFFSAHIGPAWPKGDFKELSAKGIGADLSVWRTHRRLAYGVRGSLTQFGSIPEFRQLLFAGTSGRVNQLRYTFFGLSWTSRLLLLPDQRWDPFVHVGLGAQSFKTTLQGPNVKGSNAEIAFSPDLGMGIHVNLRGDLSAELLYAYTFARTPETITVADGAVLFSNGTIDYSQIKAGLVRRLGGK
jgi:opacity protein-like surface antigen